MLTIQKIKDFFEVAESRLSEKIKDTRRNIVYGVKNLWIWFPVIWPDRNWDHQFIYEVLKHKLHLTEQLIRHDGIHINHLRDAKRIKLCVDLLDRLINDEYHETAFKSHQKKWGKPKFNWLDSKEHSDMTELKITHPNVETAEDEKKQSKQFKVCAKNEVNLREQDLDLLFKIMRKHVQEWWD
jgi:hypothetical protein